MILGRSTWAASTYANKLHYRILPHRPLSFDEPTSSQSDELGPGGAGLSRETIQSIGKVWVEVDLGTAHTLHSVSPHIHYVGELYIAYGIETP